MEKIIDYWFPNNKFQSFWFDASPDREIEEKFGELFKEVELKGSDSKSDPLSIILLYDQFTRNLSRLHSREDYTRNDHHALKLALELINNNKDLTYPIHQRVFILMPLRHQKTSIKYRELLLTVLNRIELYEKDVKTDDEKNILLKFKMATLKSFSNDLLMDTNPDVTIYDYSAELSAELSADTEYDLIKKYSTEILDKNCSKYRNIDYKERWYDISAETLYRTIRYVFTGYKSKKIGISLSGGVDSMCMAYIFKKLELEKFIAKVVAVHINYGNRTDSDGEENFVRDWCKFYDIPLIVNRITYMKRDNIDRNFYEEETRKIRFNTYKYANLKYGGIVCFCLGHHSDDVGETIMMNIFKGRDILDLSVMDIKSNIDGVEIIRPMLQHPKDDIYKFSDTHHIPYTKDTTPDWSCRGVMRKKLFPIITSQFGLGVMKHLSNLGEKSKELNLLVDKLLAPMLGTINYSDNIGCSMKITDVLINLLSENPSEHGQSQIFWTKFLRTVFHKLKVPMIKINNLESFSKWFNKHCDTIFKCSNECYAIISSGIFYIFTDKVRNIDNWSVTIEKTTIPSTPVRRKMTYDDIVNGQFVYDEKYLDSKPIERYVLYEMMEKKDTTKKIFRDIPLMRNFIPKYSSGLFRPTSEIFSARITLKFKI
jgi:tRNA(Ile)-lysidine synthetase-like protein